MVEIIRHTSDIGLKLRSKTLPTLFKNAAYGMYRIMFDQSKIEKKISKKLELSASSLDELLRNWLSELLYLFYVKGVIFSGFKLYISKNLTLTAELFGEGFDRKRHQARCEIKAVTYHKLFVKKERGFWRATIIFDI
jgi:SHS2 domain-containing protein